MPPVTPTSDDLLAKQQADLTAALASYDTANPPTDALPGDTTGAVLDAYRNQYMGGPAPASPLPAPVSPAGPMIGGGGAELAPGSVAPPGAPQAPQSGVSFPADAAPQAAPPRTQADVIKSALSALVENRKTTAEEALALDQIPANGGSGQGVMIDAQSRTQGVSQQKLPAEAKAAYKRALNHGLATAAAQRDVTMAEAAQNDAVRDAVSRQAAEMERQAAEMDALNVERADHIARVTDNVTRARSTWVSAANEEFKSKKGGISRVAGAIAAGLGAFGAALSHSQNWAQQTLDSAFEREYDEWKRGIAAKRDDVTLSQQIFNETSAMYRDKQAAKMVAHAAWTEATGKAIEKASYLNKSDITKAKGAQAASELAGLAEQRYADGTSRESIAIQSGTSNTPMLVGGNGKQETMLDRKIKMDAAAASSEKAYENVPEGYVSDAIKIKNEVMPSMALVVKSQDLIKLVDKFNVGGGGGNWSELKQKFLSMRAPMVSSIIQAASGSGVSVDEKVERLNGMFADDSLSPDKMKVAIEAYNDTAAELAALRVNSVHEALRDKTWGQLLNTYPKHVQDALRAGRRPSAEATRNEGAANGGTPLR